MHSIKGHWIHQTSTMHSIKGHWIHQTDDALYKGTLNPPDFNRALYKGTQTSTMHSIKGHRIHQTSTMHAIKGHRIHQTSTMHSIKGHWIHQTSTMRSIKGHRIHQTSLSEERTVYALSMGTQSQAMQLQKKTTQPCTSYWDTVTIMWLVSADCPCTYRDSHDWSFSTRQILGHHKKACFFLLLTHKTGLQFWLYSGLYLCDEERVSTCFKSFPVILWSTCTSWTIIRRSWHEQ